jgi:hypothetical protein
MSFITKGNLSGKAATGAGGGVWNKCSTNFSDFDKLKLVGHQFVP